MKKWLPLLMVSLFVAASAFAQDTIELQDQYSVGGWPNCAALNGETAFLALSYHVTLLNVSGENMEAIGQFDLANEPGMMFVRGDYLFVFYTFSDSSLEVLDISNPQHPVLLQRYPISSGWPVTATMTPSSIIYTTDDSVRVLDISDPASILVRATIAATGVCCAAGNDTILVAGTSDSLFVYDMTDLNAITRIHKRAMRRSSTITLQGHTAFLGITQYPDIGVKIFDLSDPAAPQELAFAGTFIKEGNTTTHLNPVHVQVEENLLYVTTTGAANLFIFDIAEINNPQLKGLYRPDRENWYQPRSLDIKHPFIYISQSNSSIPFYRLNVSDLTTPVVDALYEAPKSVLYQTLAHDTLFVASDERLWLYKIEDPYTIKLLGSSWQWNNLGGMEAKNGYLYALRNDSLFILDYTDLENIFAKGVHATTHKAFRSVIADTRTAYALTIENLASVVEFIDITNPGNPTLIATHDVQGEGRDLFISPTDSGKLYVAYSKNNADHGVTILDISAPASHLPLADIKSSSIPITIWAEDTLLFVGSNDLVARNWFLEMFSIHDLDKPTLIAMRAGEGIIWDVQVFKNRVFASLAGAINAMPAIDAPQVLNFSMLNKFTRNSDYHLARTTGGDAGPGIIAVFNIQNLALLAQFLGIHGLFMAIVWFSILGLLLFLVPAGYGNPQGLKFSASLGILALVFLFGMGGSVVTDKPEPHPFLYSLNQNYPNPFNPQTTIEFSTVVPGHVKLEVYDLRGRLVQTLVDEQKAAGSHKVDFVASGLASGVYLYQLQVGDHLQNRQMILIK